MLMLSLFRAVSATLPWLLNMTTRLSAKILAHALNMPEPLVHSTGVYVVVQVQAAEHRAARSLCPTRLLRQLRSLCRRSAR
jgi:hypothetical protein